MAMKFMPLEALLSSVNNSLVAAADKIDRSRGEVGFIVGECTFALSVELQTEGERVLARFPSAAEGEQVPPEYLSRLTLNLKRGLNLDTPR
ncbi:MAG: hypothetical protein ABWY04_17485 [Arthrobacter sp.]